MPVISIPTTFNIDVEFELPGFGRRFVALLIDMAVQFCYLILADKILNSIRRNNTWSFEDEGHNLWATILLLMVPVFVYHIVMEVTTNGQSIGKKILGIRVVNMKGGKAGISQFIIRWLLRVSDMWVVILLFLLLMVMTGSGDNETIIAFLFGFIFLVADIVLVLTSKKAQRIGDILANTILIKTRASESLDNTVFREVEDDYKPMFPQVMRITDKDLNIMKSILDNSRKSASQASAGVAAEKIKAYLGIETDLAPTDFLDRLLKDYNYLSSK